MRHGMSGRKLNRTSSHRKALFSNMANALIQSPKGAVFEYGQCADQA
jgi:ribosomal protein L17